jgi:hypothetical protein
MFKKFYFTLVLLCYLSVAFANQPMRSTGYQEYDEAISLGAHCQPAWQLRANNLRNCAYPFDALISPFDALVNFIANLGLDFLDRNMLNCVPIEGGGFYIQDLKYGLILIHDFQLIGNTLINYEEVKAKYDRRTKRFFDTLLSNKKVLFIRQDLSYEQATFLDHILHALFPNLAYTLVALNSREEAKYEHDWELERVRNFYLKQTDPYVWSGDDQAWKEILNNFKVKPVFSN